MSKKLSKLPVRPKPPSGPDILHDVNNAKTSDIVFNMFGRRSEDACRRRDLNATDFSSVSSLDDLSNVSTPQPQNNALNSGDNHIETESTQTASRVEVENMYTKALQFLDVSDQLKNSPEVLQAKCDVLDSLGHELSDLITDLKTQSQEVLNPKS